MTPDTSAPARPRPLQDREPFAGHSPQQERPLGGYAALIAGFVASSGGFALWARRRGLRLPERVAPGDLLLITVATHKSSRLLTRDRVTSSLRAPFTTFQDDAGSGEVEEAARGHGLRRAIGELLVCPYCVGMWIGGGFLAGLIAAPRQTRWIASVFAVLAGSDVLQIAYSKGTQSL